MIRIYLALFLLITGSLVSQDLTNGKLNRDSVTKNNLIYLYSANITSTTHWVTYSGQDRGSASSRSLIIRFKVGIDGDIVRLGRRGKNLKAVIQTDTMALRELRKAYHVHLRRKRICNTLEFASYFVAIGFAVPLFIGIDDGDEPNALTIGGGIGVAAGFAGILVFKNLTDKHMDHFDASIKTVIEIYNTNLLKKCEPQKP